MDFDSSAFVPGTRHSHHLVAIPFSDFGSFCLGDFSVACIRSRVVLETAGQSFFLSEEMPVSLRYFSNKCGAWVVRGYQRYAVGSVSFLGCGLST